MVPKSVNKISTMTVSNKFSKIDLNTYVISGNVVHLTFRGKLKEAILNDEVILSKIPLAAISDTFSFLTSPDNYGANSTVRWGYLKNGVSLATGAIAKDTWVHISYTYIKA